MVERTLQVGLLVTLLCLLHPSGPAQCVDWPVGCPTIADLAVRDADNTPLATPSGHTAEDICPPTVNENKELQLDVTETYTTIDSSDRLYLRSFYNTNSAASTTRQFWFFDLDRDGATGGGDNVRPDYRTTGPVSGRGPAACSTPGCSTAFLTTVHATGYEYYIQSYGGGALDFAIFRWNGTSWVEQAKPAGATNLQGAEDNPYNAYAGNNGYRGIAYLPKSAVGITDQAYRMFTRSYSCTECCGDNTGGEGVVPLPGMRPCAPDLCGDCDTSGFVDILDAFRAANYAAGLAYLDDTQYSNCNVEGVLGPSYDTQVSIVDALQIARFIVGLTLLPCCGP